MGQFHRHNHTIDIFKNPSTGIEYPSEGCLIPYAWQLAAYVILCGNKISICNVPTGAGKTLLLYMLALDYLEKNPNGKVVFLVPQTMIEKEFKDKQIEMTFGICNLSPLKGKDNESEGSRKKSLENFLTRKLINIDKKCPYKNRSYACCYKTLVNLFDDEDVDCDIFENVFFIIDEGHHIQNSENDLGITDANRLGEIIHALHKNPTIRILAATATLFRGDNKEILPKSIMTDIVRYNMTLQKMLSDSDICPNLKHISMEYILSGVELSKICKNINETPKKTGWWIPNVLTSESSGKIEDVKSVLKSFGNRITDNAKLLMRYGIGEEEISDGYGIVEYYRDKGGYIHRVIDLALDDDNKLYSQWKNRNEREDYLQEIQNEKKDGKFNRITDVIALNKMKEGTNWKPMERIVIVGYRKSLVDQIQIIGRGFRDWPGKELVEVIHIIPWNLANLDEETTIDNVRNHLKCICGIFVLEDFITPFYMNMPKLEKEQIERMERQKNIIERVFEGNENRVNEFYNNVSFDLYRECSGKTVGEAKELLKGIVEKNLDNIGISVGEELEDVVEYVYRKLAVMKMKIVGIDVRGINFEFIEKYDITDGWWQLFSKNIGSDILKAFEGKYKESLLERLRVNGNSWKTFDEHIEYIKEVFSKTGVKIDEIRKYHKHYEENELWKYGYCKYPWDKTW